MDSRWTGLREAIGRRLALELHQCRSELVRLEEVEHKPVSVPTAVTWSACAVVLGNGVVLAGRRWGHSEMVTLVANPAIGLAGASLLRRRGWSWADLGVRAVASDPPARVPTRFLFVALAIGGGFGLVGLASFDAKTVQTIGRLVIGTAIGEELIHRSVMLGVWTDTHVRARWIVVANMATFGMWHIAAATHRTGFKWWQVAVPAVGAAPFLWARLRFRSVLAPSAFHASVNMPGVVLGALLPDRQRRGDPLDGNAW